MWGRPENSLAITHLMDCVNELGIEIEDKLPRSPFHLNTNKQVVARNARSRFPKCSTLVLNSQCTILWRSSALGLPATDSRAPSSSWGTPSVEGWWMAPNWIQRFFYQKVQQKSVRRRILTVWKYIPEWTKSLSGLNRLDNLCLCYINFLTFRKFI